MKARAGRKLDGARTFFLISLLGVCGLLAATAVMPSRAAGATSPRGAAPKRSSLAISLSATALEQGDTLVVKVAASEAAGVTGSLGSLPLSFFQTASSGTWLAVVGIDAKSKPGRYALTLRVGERRERREARIVKRKFPVTELVVSKQLKSKGYTPAKIAESLRTRENAALQAALRQSADLPYFRGSFGYPLEEIVVQGAFGNVRRQGKVALQHLGVDLKAATGTPVYAANDGLVVFADELPTYGKTVIIDHGLGISTLYLHLDQFRARVGSRVQRADIVALAGNSGYSLAPHLHYSLKVRGANVDPLRFTEVLKREMGP